MPIKLLDVELTQTIEAATDLAGYEAVRFLVKLHDLPLGYFEIPATNSIITAQQILDQIFEKLTPQIINHLNEDKLLSQQQEQELRSAINSATLVNLLAQLNQTENEEAPCVQLMRQKANQRVSIIICSRDGAERLPACLDALDAIDYPDYEIIVVDNASKDDSICKLLEQRGIERYRYITEPRPGVSWARNTGVAQATGTIIAFTDDDARPDSLWLLSLVAAVQRPGISLVVGAGYPAELKNDTQIHCAKFWGQDRPFERVDYDINYSPKYVYATNSYGGCYNLAAWRDVLVKSGGFDAALGRGSRAGSASDADLFYRLLRQGHTISYEPSSLVRLVYPDDVKFLKRHDFLGASGVFAFLTKCFLAEHNYTLVRYIAYLFWNFYLRPWLKCTVRRNKMRREIATAALRGALAGPFRYFQSRRQAKLLAR